MAQSGLAILAEAVVAKGKSAVEKKLGITLPSSSEQLTPELLGKLKEAQNTHEQFLVNAALEEAKLDLAASGEVSERWKADMASDNSLSKNVRPAVLIFLLFLFSVFSIASIYGIAVAPVYVTLLGELIQLVFMAYFVGRSTEKVVDMVGKRKS